MSRLFASAVLAVILLGNTLLVGYLWYGRVQAWVESWLG